VKKVCEISRKINIVARHNGFSYRNYFRLIIFVMKKEFVDDFNLVPPYPPKCQQNKKKLIKLSTREFT